jgi:hypothetical protein
MVVDGFCPYLVFEGVSVIDGFPVNINISAQKIKKKDPLDGPENTKWQL